MNKAMVGSQPTESVLTSSGRRRRPGRSEAEAAVRTLIEWAGDDPDRAGLTGTPERVVRTYGEFFAGYHEDPVTLLETTFEETADYDEMIVLRDIRLESHCEHHIVPILGKAHIGYLPTGRVVGISKLARPVEVFAKRMQIQRVGDLTGSRAGIPALANVHNRSSSSVSRCTRRRCALASTRACSTSTSPPLTARPGQNSGTRFRNFAWPRSQNG